MSAVPPRWSSRYQALPTPCDDPTDLHPRAPATPRWLAGDTAWATVAVLISLVLRLIHIGHQPFWLDEALTFQRIHLNLHDLVNDSISNRHMPSYFLMLQWLLPFDTDAAQLRAPSALLGALSVGVIYAITQRIGGRGAAIIASLLMAFSPLQVQYGQEARSYTLVTLLIAIALWGLLKLAQDPYRAAIGPRSRDFDVWGWGCYLFGTIAALDVLGTAAPWLLASNVSLWLTWRQLGAHPGLQRQFWHRWLLGQALVAVCCLPFYGAIVLVGGSHMLQNFDWIPQMSWRTLWIAAKSVYLMRMATVVQYGLMPTAVPWLGPWVALLGCAGVYRMRHRLDGRMLILAFLTLPMLMIAVSLFKSMLLPRYILWSAAPFFVLAGLGAAALPRRALPVLGAMLLLVSAINLAPVYRVETKPRWDVAAATLAAHVQPGDTVLTADPNAPTMLSVLTPKNQVPIHDKALVTQNVDVALERWKQGGRVWAVNGRSAMGVREDVDTFKNQLAALGKPSAEIAQGKEITILMFQAPTAAN
ncbi:glycosyltransferase family 39 protein [Dyella sp.]|uniref:glycosyltransferase family 39 protein n=1 Tax=Dyella sp. TaxID=1869338 RepID=UPI002ED6A61B